MGPIESALREHILSGTANLHVDASFSDPTDEGTMWEILARIVSDTPGAQVNMEVYACLSRSEPAPAPERKRPTLAAELEVWQRDGNTCQQCGNEVRPARLLDQRSPAQRKDIGVIDHVIRHRDGGPSTADNLQILCWPCNAHKA